MNIIEHKGEEFRLASVQKPRPLSNVKILLKNFHVLFAVTIHKGEEVTFRSSNRVFKYSDIIGWKYYEF